MIEILSGKTGTLHMVFGWMLTLYPLVTLPALLGFYYETQEENETQAETSEHQRARITLEPEEFASFQPRNAETSEAIAAPRNRSEEAPVVPEESQVVPEESTVVAEEPKPAPGFTLEQLLEALKKASSEEEPTVKPRSAALSMAEMEALTAPHTPADLQVDPTPIHSASSIRDFASPFEYQGSSSQERAQAYLKYRSTIRPASDRRTLSQARRVATNPRMKPWVREAAQRLLARTGTDG